MLLRKLFQEGPNFNQNSKPFWSFRLGRATEVHLPPKDEGPRDIVHKMIMVLNTRKSNFVSQ